MRLREPLVVEHLLPLAHHPEPAVVDHDRDDRQPLRAPQSRAPGTSSGSSRRRRCRRRSRPAAPPSRRSPPACRSPSSRAPPDVMNERGFSHWMYCIAHIWCWPTPVVQITSSSRVAARSRSASIAVCGFRTSCPSSAYRNGNCSRQSSSWRSHGAWSGAPFLRQAALHLRGELRERELERADDRDLRVADLPDLGRIDVEMDHLRARRERRHLAGDAVVEARADRDHEVGLVQRPVRELRAVHPGRAVVERMRVGQAALAHQRHDRRQAAPSRRARAARRRRRR